jgi:hypothetical protein
MTNRESIAKKFGVERLEDYIKEEFLKGKAEAEIEFDKFIIETSDDLQIDEKEDVLKHKVLFQIATYKTIVNKLNNEYFFQMIQQSKEYFSYPLTRTFSENDQLDRLAKYILDYYDFKSTPNHIVESQLLKIKEKSAIYHSCLHYISYSIRLFEILNDKCKIEGFTWDWFNFEDGLLKVLTNHTIEIIAIKGDYEAKIKILEFNNKSGIDSLTNKIQNLKEDIKNEINKNEFLTEFQKKYYENSPIDITQTYFGDNLPFLFNLFNFLKRNNLLQFGWSYFYSCMITGNNEMIPLKKPKKLNFIGRIFYHLTDYLVLQYKEQPLQFLKSKFLIDENYITDSFKNNHMKPNFDKIDEPELMIVDDFFEKQEKIYLKM